VVSAAGPSVRWRAYGADAVLAEVDGALEAQSLAAYARQAGLEVTEVVPGATTVLFDGLPAGGAESVAGALRGWRPSPGTEDGPVVEVRVVFDGPDLAAMAQRWGTTEDGVIQRLTGVSLRSAFCGFAPGFAYLAGLPSELAVPRLETPRPRVPAGSVALADTWCGIYPSASPGGWLLVGRTEAVLWDPARPEPALLAPGTRVRLRA
jgi:KipI family sensor histidine kinase inhibitor